MHLFYCLLNIKASLLLMAIFYFILKDMTSRLPKPRAIYTKNYYKAQAMIKDPWFLEKESWLRKRFLETGCPLPKNPFKKYAQYLEWNKKFWKRYAAMEKSEEYLAEKERTVGNKENVSPDEYFAFEEFRENFLPPVYGNVFDEILEHFKIDPKDKGFQGFLEHYFFFGQREYIKSPFGLRWIKNPETGKTEFFVRIYGHTKKEDIIDNWDWIAEDQKLCEDYIGKNKAWKTFDRDIEIYTRYKKMKEKGIKRHHNNWAMDTVLLNEFDKKYPELTLTRIRAIITKTRERLGEN